MPQVITSVKALIQVRDTYLVLKETLHHGEIWDLPGGKIEYGEEPIQALLREVGEEVGLRVQVVRSVGVWWFYSSHNKHQVICHTFLCRPIGKIVIDLTKNPADEHFSEFRWLTIPEILANPEIQLSNSLRGLLMEYEA